MAATVHHTSFDLPRVAQLGSTQRRLNRLFPINVLFGKNGSGKSVILRGIRNTQVETSHYIVPERGGNINFHPDNLPDQLEAAGRRRIYDRNDMGGYRNTVVARIAAYFQARGAVRDGQSSGRIEDIEQLLAVLFPDFSMELVSGNPPFRLHRVGDPATRITSTDSLSSGEAQMLTLGLDVVTMAATWDLQRTPRRLLLVDEPDAHIHPDLQVRFADFLVRVADKFDLQVIVATHSTTLLAAIGQFAHNNCGVIYLTREGTAYDARPFTPELKEIAACLGGHALMGPLFGFPLVLVEGDDDYRVWSQVPRHGIANISVIPSHGEEIKKYQVSLERIFAALRDARQGPAAYALLDGDKGVPQSTTAAPQDHVRFLRLACREIENLYLTDEVLALIGTNWNEAAAAIAAASSQHGNKATQLASAARWDRKTDDLKPVIEEVSRAIDRKNVHWTQRVGTAIGRARPSGQLADFLGESIVATLWTLRPNE